MRKDSRVIGVEAVIKAGTPAIKLLTFAVRGEPAPWTVYTRRGEPTLSFMRMKSWQAQIALTARAQMSRRIDSQPFGGPLRLEMEFYRSIPAGAQLDEYIKTHIIARPDLRNLEKACEDALKGILFIDDSQVVSSEGTKGYTAGEPYTTIRLYRVEV